MSRPRVGLATIAHRRHDHLDRQLESLLLGDRRPDVYVVAAMDDHVIDEVEVGGLCREVVRLEAPEGLPLAAARNLAVEALLDRDVEVVVGLDVDCLAGPGLIAAYTDIVLADPGRVWSGPVTYLPPPPSTGYDMGGLETLDAPHPARPAPAPGAVLVEADPDLFWSLSFALTASAWRTAGGFCEQYVGYGGEDTDFARTAAAAGLGFGWVGAARAYHQHHPVSSPPVEHVDDILRNGRLFRGRWGEWPMRGWLEQLEDRGVVRRVGDDWRRV